MFNILYRSVYKSAQKNKLYEKEKKSLVKNIQKVSSNYTVVSYKVNSKYRKCSVFFRIFKDKKNRNKLYQFRNWKCCHIYRIVSHQFSSITACALMCIPKRSKEIFFIKKSPIIKVKHSYFNCCWWKYISDNITIFNNIISIRRKCSHLFLMVLVTIFWLNSDSGFRHFCPAPFFRVTLKK